MEDLVSIGWAAFAGLLIYRAFRQRRLLAPIDGGLPFRDNDAPSVTVIVPARDEASKIGSCLDGLSRQVFPYRRLRILVVDDQSSDGTAAVVAGRQAEPSMADSSIDLLRSPALPPGWLGKSHACWVGARAASPGTEWLCFLDADVQPEPAFLASALRAAQAEEIDLLSLAPRQRLCSFAERLILPCGLFLLAFRQDLGRKQAKAADAAATGQCMLIHRAAYLAVGGHAAVASEICEDLELARRMKRRGFKVALRDGAQLLSTRMYTGWATLWPGLAKNLVDTLGGPVATLATSVAAIVLAWAALLIPALAGLACASSNGPACAGAALAGLGSAALFALHLAGARHFRIPAWYGFLFPVGYTVGALLALDSLRLRLNGRVSWKGRTYTLSAKPEVHS